MDKRSPIHEFQEQPSQWARLSYLAIGIPVALGIIAGLAFFLRLTQFQDPPGANGYFYMKQTESLANGVGFYFKDRSLAFSLPVLLYWITGNSLSAFQLAVGLTWGALCAGAGALSFLLAQALTKRDMRFAIGAGILAVLACATAVPTYEFACNYYKNLFGLMLFTWSLCCFYWPNVERKAKVIRVLGLTLLLASLLSHKSFFLLATLLGFSYFIQDLRKNLSGRKLLGLLGVAVAAIALFFFHFEKGSAYLRALFSFFQNPHPWMGWLSQLYVREPAKAIEMVVLAGGSVAYLAQRRRIEARFRVAFDAAVLLIVLSLQPFQVPGPNAPAYRMMLLAPVLILPLLIGLSARSSKSLLIGLALLSLHFSQVFISHRTIASYITPWSSMRADALQIKAYVSPADHLTSHHGLEFFIDYVTGIRSRSFISENSKQKAYRLAYVPRYLAPDGLARDEINQAKILDVGKDYVLIPEEDWRRIQTFYSLPFNWKNPMAKRPEFIYE